MRTWRKAVVAVLLASASVAVLFVVFLNTLIEKNRARIQEEIQKAIGRPLMFAELRLSLWPGIGVSAKDVSIADDPRSGAIPFIQTKELKMQARWLPLLVGDFEIKKVSLDEPKIQIIKNHAGRLNVPESQETRKKEQREVKEVKQRFSPRLRISAVQVTNGRIDYIDRSLKKPTEIHARNVNMEVQGFALTGTIKAKLSASLFDAQGQTISVEGRAGPWEGNKNWTQQALDLQVNINSLPLARLSQALNLYKDEISSFALTGPLNLKAKLSGTFEQPRITNLTLTGPSFGSAESNTTLTGDLDFSNGGDWTKGKVKSKIVIHPLSLNQLKQVPFFQRSLPSDSRGPLSITGELQGSLEDLKVNAVIKAQESEIQYGDWLRKAKGVPAEMELKAGIKKKGGVFGARVEDSKLRWGSSELGFEGAVENLSNPNLHYSLRSPKLSLADFAGPAAHKTDEIKSLQVKGELQMREGKPTVRATFSTTDGTLQEVPYQKLGGEMIWFSNSLNFKNLSFQALNGMFRANAAWDMGGRNLQRLLLDCHIENVDLKSVAQKFPKFKGHVEGQLNLKATLRGEGKNGAALQESLQGEGTTNIRGGSLRDFNLVESLLSKVSGLPGISQLLSARIPARHRPMFQRKDTPFENLSATFAIKQGRISSEDLLLITPDYSVTGQGWVGFDKSMKWNGRLSMSSQFTQDLMQEHRNVRYMVDREGKLSVPFRLEGTLPKVRAKPDAQMLAETIQRGMAQKGMDRLLREDKDRKKKDRRELIQKGLEQFLGK